MRRAVISARRGAKILSPDHCSADRHSLGARAEHGVCRRGDDDDGHDDGDDGDTGHCSAHCMWGDSGGSFGRKGRRRWWARIRADDECLVDATRISKEGLDECVTRFDVIPQKVHESRVAFHVERKKADLEMNI